ncbi:MAG: RidA family protein [Actinomycetota bacterium]|nr:RidA family protein [Actinomycetota bacterium]
MPREIVNPPELFPPPGFSHIAVATGSRLAFIAGEPPLGADMALVGAGDLAAQTRQVLENLLQALAALDAGWEDVVRSTVWTTQPHEYAVIGAVVAEALGGAAPPAQVIAGVTGLALPEMLIEIDLVVSLP